jgi:hypothetical protein
MKVYNEDMNKLTQSVPRMYQLTEAIAQLILEFEQETGLQVSGMAVKPLPIATTDEETVHDPKTGLEIKIALPVERSATV